MGSTKVTLREREYPSGKVSLYLDFYPRHQKSPHWRREPAGVLGHLYYE